MNLSIKRILVLLVQLTISAVVLFLLFQGINFDQTIEVLSTINFPLLISAIVFFVLSSLTVGLALHTTLKSCGVSIPVQSSVSASYGGQLLSDITPAKSGYFATSVLLRELKQVSMEKGLMSVMAMGAVNFFIKAILAAVALLYFLNRIPMDPSLANALLVGIGLLLIGGIGLTILVWTNYMPNLLKKLSGIPYLGRLIVRFEPVLELFNKDQTLLKKSIKTTSILIISSVFTFTIGILLLSNAVDMPQPSFVDLFFIGPLTAVFMYVPVTFAGLGLQEAAYVFLLTSIGALEPNALAFALLVRVLFITTDLIGLPALIKTGTGLVNVFNNNSKDENVS